MFDLRLLVIQLWVSHKRRDKCNIAETTKRMNRVVRLWEKIRATGIPGINALLQNKDCVCPYELVSKNLREAGECRSAKMKNAVLGLDEMFCEHRFFFATDTKRKHARPAK